MMILPARGKKKTRRRREESFFPRSEKPFPLHTWGHQMAWNILRLKCNQSGIFRSNNCKDGTDEPKSKEREEWGRAEEITRNHYQTWIPISCSIFWFPRFNNLTPTRLSSWEVSACNFLLSGNLFLRRQEKRREIPSKQFFPVAFVCVFETKFKFDFESHAYSKGDKSWKVFRVRVFDGTKGTISLSRRSDGECRWGNYDSPHGEPCGCSGMETESSLKVNKLSNGRLMGPHPFKDLNSWIIPLISEYFMHQCKLMNLDGSSSKIHQQRIEFKIVFPLISFLIPFGCNRQIFSY